ncbi:MAG: carbohydrate-binding domain-containing protein [Lachnospiraceae bacterium]|nr:carbohydrate-binding domain-containing protein [Lachnospiraceae bacterium]
MSTNKHFDLICVIVTICAVIVTLLFINGKAIGITPIVDEDSENYEGTEYFTANDQDASWTENTDDMTIIDLHGSGADIDGNGAYFYDGDLYITGSGKYAIGGISYGSIIVDAYESSKVYILLDMLGLTCDDNACFIVNQADKVFLTLAEGSDNSFVSGTEYSDEALADEITGVIFSHDDLTINGSGSLTVTGGFKHGIVAKDDLVITGGNISVEAPTDGIRANDSLRIRNADITVDAGDDGMVLNHEGGYFYMESGSLDVTSGDDGIHAGGDVTVVGGDITISANDDGIHSDTAFLINDGTITINECYEGIEAETIDIAGGDTLIYPKDDGLNANGGSGDMFGMGDGMGGPGDMGGHHMGGGSESANSVSGNMKDFPDSWNKADVSGNMPNMSIDMNMDEDKSVTASEEGNQDSDDSGSEEAYVKISGGNLTIINDSGNDADGIDSNGDLIITGGTVRVSLVNNGNNSALDYGSESGGVAEISGGTVIACGNYSMAEQFDSSSTQASILYTYSDGAEAGTKVALEDTDGSVILEYEVPQTFSSMNMSCPEMQVGETYLVVIGDNVEEITIDEISASYGDATSGGFGGSMNFGGMQPRGDFGGFGGDHGMGGFASGNGMERGGHGGPPDMNSSQGITGGPGDMPGDETDGADEEGTEAAQAAVSGTTLTEFGSDTWTALGTSVAAIIAGICVAVIYKRRWKR